MNKEFINLIIYIEFKSNIFFIKKIGILEI